MDTGNISVIACPPDEQAQLLQGEAPDIDHAKAFNLDSLKAKHARWGFYLYSWAVEVGSRALLLPFAF